jgi:Carboxypeptidase regulatory-like domain
LRRFRPVVEGVVKKIDGPSRQLKQPLKSGARIVITTIQKFSTDHYSLNLIANYDGTFETASVPVGAYQVNVTRDGFAPAAQNVVVISGSAPVLHFQLVVIGLASFAPARIPRCGQRFSAQRKLFTSMISLPAWSTCV